MKVPPAPQDRCKVVRPRARNWFDRWCPSGVVVMRRRLRVRSAIVAVLGTILPASSAAAQARIPLANGWRIQSSAAIRATGDAISRPGFSADGWHPATVPGTVVAALVEGGRL